MFKNLLSFIVFLTSLLLLFSCKDKTPAEPEKIDYSYFPLDSGRYFIYQIDTINYDEFKMDTTKGSYQERDVISGSTRDNSNRIIKQIDRYRRANDSAAWQFVETYTANLTTATAEVVEDNQRIIKLTFPVAQGKTWNGNAYINNNSGENVMNFKYSVVGESAIILGKTYPGTATVIENDDKNLIKKQSSLEKYSQNIGLVYKEFINDSSTSQDLSTPFDQRITGGIEIRTYLKSYGK